MIWYNNAENNGQQINKPLTGGKTDIIEPLLKFSKPLPPPGTPGEFFLVLKNNTDARIEGWLKLIPPREWEVAPGSQLMIAIRAEGTIVAEFYLTATKKQPAEAALLNIQITSQKELLAEAAFKIM